MTCGDSDLIEIVRYIPRGVDVFHRCAQLFVDHNLAAIVTRNT